MTAEVAAAGTPASTTRRPGRRTLIVGTIALAALALGVGTAYFRGGGGDATRDGAALLALVLPDAQGQPQPLAQWRGKVLVVNFWATWCAPCREEMPLLDATQKRFAANGLQIVGIANDNVSATREFLAKTPVGYPILVDDPEHGDLSERLGNSRDVLPYTVLVGRDGRIVARRPGNFSERALDAWLAPHL